MPRVLIVDDHPLFRKALVSVVTRNVHDAQCVEIPDIGALAAVLVEERLDIVLLDLFLPGVQGFACMAELNARAEDVPVVIVSASRDPELIEQARLFGASGFLHKSLPEDRIAQAIRTVLAGGTCFPDEVTPPAAPTGDPVGSLTPRQAETLQLLGRGLSNKEIARVLSVSHETVKAHISAVLRKLQVGSRTEAVIVAHGLMQERRPDC